MWVFRLAIRNALRNVRRSLLTATTVMLGVALLVAALAWIQGVLGSMIGDTTDAIGHVRIVDPEYAEREALMPLYANLADVEPILEAVRAVPEVTAAYPVIQAGVTVTVDEEIGDVFGLAVGARPEFFAKHMDGRDSLQEGGSWFSEAGDEVILGRRLAEKADAELGDEVVLLGQTQHGSISPIKGTLIGITGGGTQLTEQQAWVSLDKMQWLTDIPDGAIEIRVYGEDHDQAEAIAETLRADPALEGLTVQAWTEREPFAGMMGLVDVMQGIIVVIIVFITSLAIWNTTMMSVLERTDEIGVLRAMGLGRFATVLLFVSESCAIAAVGGLAGLALGAPLALYLEHTGITLGEQVAQNVSSDFVLQTTMYGDFNPSIAASAFALGLVMALVGSLAPSIRAAAIQPADAMRTGR